ncbi:MAG: preQ(1) synthase [Acidimicrobiales bacterium]
MTTRPTTQLMAVANPEPGREYEVRCDTPEFTCLCPLTGQPDFATVTISYVPNQWIVELKSLKLYLWHFRDMGAFHEAVTNQILDDFLATVKPRRVTVCTDWRVRGGIHTVVEASHPDPGATGAPAADGASAADGAAIGGGPLTGQSTAQ